MSYSLIANFGNWSFLPYLNLIVYWLTLIFQGFIDDFLLFLLQCTWWCWSYRNIWRDLVVHRDWLIFTYSPYSLIVIVIYYIGLVYELWLLPSAMLLFVCLRWCCVIKHVQRHSLFCIDIHTVCSRVLKIPEYMTGFSI